jgi:hypothetical protein
VPRVPPARHLLRAKDFADARYAEPITVERSADGVCREAQRSVLVKAGNRHFGVGDFVS